MKYLIFTLTFAGMLYAQTDLPQNSHNYVGKETWQYTAGEILLLTPLN